MQNYSIIYNRILSPTVANQFAAGVSYFNQVFGNANTGFSPIGLGLNTGVTDPSLPGAPHLVIVPTAPSGRNDITGHLDEDLTWAKGTHQYHFGGEYRQPQVDDFYQTGQRGTIYLDSSQGPWTTANFVGTTPQTPCAALATKNQGIAAAAGATSNLFFLADFLASCPNPNASSIILGNPKRQVFINPFTLYGQDAWQVSKTLNLNYGVRYNYEGPVHSAYPNLSVFDPTTASGLAIAGQNVANIYPQFSGGVSPRVGFAVQLDHTGFTVMHGGYGFTQREHLSAADLSAAAWSKRCYSPVLA